MEEKSIGIITFHCAENYGAFLQTLASQSTLEELFPNSKVKVVDYRPDFIKNTYRLYFPRRKEFRNFISYLRSLGVNLYFTPSRVIRKWKFHKAIKLLHLSKPYTPEKKWRERFEWLYLGSDQIWNIKITKGIDPVYFALLNNCDDARRIAYAASIGEHEFDDETKNIVRSLLSKIQAISLREESSAEYLYQLTQRRYTVVLDPTLLRDKIFWASKAKSKSKWGKYVLIYMLSTNPQIYQDAAEYAREMKVKVICIGEVGKKNSYINGINILGYPALDPFEFLGAVLNAECVFTNSFHGTCFSIVFERQFYSYLSEKRNNRILDLAQKLGVENRIIPFGESFNLKTPQVDFCKIKETLQYYVHESRSFLINNIRM